MQNTVKQILAMKPDNSRISAEGWVRTIRRSGTLAFIEMNDGSCLKSLQIVADENFGSPEILTGISTGASITAEGILAASPGKEQSLELRADKIIITGSSPSDYPLQKKKHSLEFLRDIAHLRARTNSIGAVSRIRSEMSFAIHRFFHDRGFFYVHTPIITGSDCEGAGEMFQVTTLSPEKLKSSGYEEDFFGKRAALTVSGQLEGETYAMALKNIYTFGPTFRAENSNTARHLAEFWMVEPEMAFCSINGNMDTAEEFLKAIFSHVLENCSDDMDFFDQRIAPGVIESLNSVVKSDFHRITYTEGIHELEKAGDRFQFPVSWGMDLQSEHEKFLTEEVYRGPVIVTDYPAEIKAFYMKMNEDRRTVRGMDVLVPRLGEIIGGSERESDYDRLMERLLSAGLNPKDYWWYLDLRRYGTVPHSGFGLGFERVIQYVTGMKNIRDVIPYPRTVKSLEF